jgi:hypothetical protein
MLRVALCAPLSSDRQRDVSIEDQLRLAGQLGMLFEHYARSSSGAVPNARRNLRPVFD